jgi:hypothetical protein
MSSRSLFDETIEAGTEILIKVKNKRSSVARLILSHVQGKQYVVLTPSGEIVLDDFSDVATAAIRDASSRSIPLGMGKVTEDFDELPSSDEFNALADQGDELAEKTRAESPGNVVQSAQPALVRKTAVLLAPPPTSGSVAAPLSGGLGALASALGGITPLAPKASTAAVVGSDAIEADARVLAVRYDNQGQRFRDFRDCVNLTTTPAWADWPITGPRTATWCLKWMLHRAGSPLGWHQQWVQLGRLSEEDPVVRAHEFACRGLETGACYDQLDLGALACFEIFARQLQTCEDLLSHKFHETDDGSSADLYLMSGAQHKSQLCISPELRAFTATETSKRYAIMKERRKAREERVLAQPKHKAGGGKG